MKATRTLMRRLRSSAVDVISDAMVRYGTEKSAYAANATVTITPMYSARAVTAAKAGG